MNITIGKSWDIYYLRKSTTDVTVIYVNYTKCIIIKPAMVLSHLCQLHSALSSNLLWY